MEIEKNTNSSALTQTDLVSSPILWQCLYLIRTVPEFRNLTYRITKTRNDVEVVVVYREGVLGIFGPAVEPITLTFDGKGRCLLTVLFKPLERVSIVSPENGQVEVASLFALLRLIAGKGYAFCPGIPEKFLAGKACGKLVTLQRIPFKRYQSSQCPVYYQVPAIQQSSKQSSLCALCPRCLQTAKWIHAMPAFASNASGGTAHLPAQLPSLADIKSDDKVVTRNIVVTQANGDIVAESSLPVSVGKLLSFTNTVAPVSGMPQLLKGNFGSSQLDVNGNSQVTLSFKEENVGGNITDIAVQETSTAAKLQAFKDILLKEKCQKKLLDLVSEITGVKIESLNSKKATDFSSPSQQRKNVCRLCKKHFSTSANLLNHIARHGTWSTTWQKYRQQKQQKNANLSGMHGVCRRSKLLPIISRRNRSWSEASFRLFLKCLGDVIRSRNGARPSSQQECRVSDARTACCMGGQTENEGSQLVSCMQAENNTCEKRPSLKRTSSGLSPMQTLLEAAAIAEVSEDAKVSSPSSLTSENFQATATVQQPAVPAEIPQAGSSPKKPRKSSRLASKRAKKNKKKHDDKGGMKTVEAENVSHEQSMLTNLNLLSTVSLETAMFQQPSAAPQIQAACSSSLPHTTLPPDVMTNAATVQSSSGTITSHSTLNHSPLKSVSVPHQLLNNTSGGNVVISRPQDTSRPFVSANVPINSNLPPLPPLLFAGDVGRKALVLPFLSQKQQNQPQTVTASTSSLLRNLVTLGKSSLTPPEPKVTLNHSPINDCGAIDLSKPKAAQLQVNLPVSTERGGGGVIDLSTLSGLPHNIAQLVAGNGNASEVLQCFMTMTHNPNVDVPESKVNQAAITSSHQNDSDLQARMFASARNYRIDKGATNAPQVQAVIASSSRMTQPGKGVKSGVSSVQSDEIQCGYKWSGSGGLVKERTQMVREVVPPDVMAGLLAKSHMVNQPQNVSTLNTLKPQQPVLQAVQSSLPDWPHQVKGQEQLPTDLALNLITNKPTDKPPLKKELSGRSLKSLPIVVSSSSPPTYDWSPTSPGSTKRSILRTSLTNKVGNTNQQLAYSSVTSGCSNTGSPHKIQPKISNISSPSSLAFPVTPPPSTCTISSPSLAAMLRQPVVTMYEAVNGNPLTVSVTNNSGRKSVTNSCSLLPLPVEVCIKAEPADSYGSEKNTVILTLPVKAETEDSHPERVQDDGYPDTDSSPSNLVMDITPDARAGRKQGSKLKSINTAVSIAQDLANNSVRCKH